MFNSNAVNCTMEGNTFVGWGNISLNSGLTTDMLIQGSQPIVMAPSQIGAGGV